MRRRLAMAVTATALAAAPDRAFGAEFVLKPGESVAALRGQVQGGDEIVLAPGRHAALDLSGFRGTAERPLVVRGPAPGRPAPVLAGAAACGLRLDGAEHVVVQDLVIFGGAQAAVVAGPAVHAGEPKDAPAEIARGGADLTLRNVVMLFAPGASSSSSADGVRADGVRGLTVDGCRLEGIGGVAVRLHDCSEVTLQGMRFVGGGDADAAVAATGRCRDLRLAECRVEGGFRTGLALGCRTAGAEGGQAAPAPGAKPPVAGKTPPFATPDAPPRAPAAAPTPGTAPAPAERETVEDVRVERCVFLRGLSAWTLGDVRRVLFERCTVALPRGVLFTVEDGPDGASGVVLRRNLFCWPPGSLRRIADVPAGLPSEAIRLEENLWWSPELELARDQLGGFPGVVTAPQVTTIDPQIDAGGNAFNPAAAPFGAGLSQPEAPPAPFRRE